MEMIQEACMASLYADLLSDFCSMPSGPKTSGTITTSTATSCTVVRERLVVLRGGRDCVACSLDW